PRPTPDISTLSLHDALPISMDTILNWMEQLQRSGASFARLVGVASAADAEPRTAYRAPNGDRIAVTGVHYAYDGGPDVLVDVGRSEEHTSELQSRANLVCRL